MAIDTGRILGISDKQYFDLIGDKSPNYTYAKVEVEVGSTYLSRETFAKAISNETDVVVDYKEKLKGINRIILSGTALIPKEKPTKIENEEPKQGKKTLRQKISSFFEIEDGFQLDI